MDSLAEMIRQGIEAANEDLKKENDARLMQEVRMLLNFLWLIYDYQNSRIFLWVLMENKCCHSTHCIKQLFATLMLFINFALQLAIGSLFKGVVRQIPLMGSLFNWLSPLDKEAQNIRGRSFNLKTGIREKLGLCWEKILKKTILSFVVSKFLS